MPTDPTGTTPPVTPDTLSDSASRADLGAIDAQTALIIKVCEARIEKRYVSEVADIRARHNGLRERHLGALRELREKLNAVRLDDFLKIGTGLLAGVVIRAFGDRGEAALKEPWVGYQLFFLLLGVAYFVVHHLIPTQRKREIDRELANVERDRDS